MQDHRRDQSQQVTATNFQDHPNSTWGFHHVRALHPSAGVRRGSDSTQRLAKAPEDLGSITFEVFGERRMSVSEMLDSHYTDGFLVLHRGAIAMEHYGHGMRAQDTHILMSTTKSFTGSLAGVLSGLGVLDETAMVTDVLPYLRGTGYDGATVRHLLDMRVGLDFSEDYQNPKSDFAYLDAAFGWRPAIEAGAPDHLLDFVKTVRANAPHGGRFHYPSVNAPIARSLPWARSARSSTWTRSRSWSSPSSAAIPRRFPKARSSTSFRPYARSPKHCAPFNVRLATHTLTENAMMKYVKAATYLMACQMSAWCSTSWSFSTRRADGRSSTALRQRRARG